MNITQLAKKLKKLNAKQADAILKEVHERVDSQQKLAVLLEERQKLVKSLTNLDFQIAKLEGRAGRADGSRYKRVGRVRDRSQPTIVQRAINILTSTPQGMRITDLANAIRKAGHHTLSKPRTFVTAVYLAIKRDSRFRKLSKGVYALRANIAKSAGGGS